MNRHSKRLTNSTIARTMEAGDHVAAAPRQDPMPSRPRRTIPLLLTLLVVLCVGLAGTWASTASLTDEVSLVALEVHGGTLALDVVESGFGLGGAALATVPPGHARARSFTVTNTGSIPADLSFVVASGSGTDPSGCFDYELQDAADQVVLVSGSLARAVNVSLGVIEPGATGSRAYTIRIVNREDCATNGATGSLVAKISAIQQGAGS